MPDYLHTREIYDRDAISTGMVKTAIEDAIALIARLRQTVNDNTARENLTDLQAGLVAELHNSMNAGSDRIATILADFDAEDDALYLREDRADYHGRVL